jgi:hypothetical protein
VGVGSVRAVSVSAVTNDAVAREPPPRFSAPGDTSVVAAVRKLSCRRHARVSCGGEGACQLLEPLT